MKNLKTKVFTFTSTLKSVKEEDDGGITIRGMASTNDVDRAGDVIPAKAWTKGGLNNFKKNPIILFNHNYDMPIGRATAVEVTDKGLELEARISSAEPKYIKLIKDGVLGAFSVGFLVKDVDYIEETGGFEVKDAELLETSVVSVPCNQSATFSLAKSFDSKEEWEDFKKTFSVNLSDQPQKSEGESEGGTISPSGENTMDKEVQTVDLDALAEQAAEKLAAKLEMKEAARRAAEKRAAEEKAAKEEADKAVNEAIKAGVSGTEKMVADLREELAKKDADMQEVIKSFKSELEEKAEELKQMRTNRMRFAPEGGNSKSAIEAAGKELMYASVFNTITKKGWNEGYAAQVLEKAGLEYTAAAPDIDQEVSRQIEKEIQKSLRVARLFREIRVNGLATVLPIQPDVGVAEWKASTNGNYNSAGGNLENRYGAAPTADTYEPAQVTLYAYRLVSGTFMDNEVDEKVLVELMPMLVEGVARAHARSVERMCLLGDEKSSSLITGLDGFAANSAKNIDLNGTSAGTNYLSLTAAALMDARAAMGRYGINPEDVTYIVSHTAYYDLIKDGEFLNMNEVGDLATKVRGAVGQVYGSNVVVSDEFPAAAAAAPAAFAVYTPNYVIPRLRDVRVEQDYEVWNQRRVIVASQSLGFTELVAGGANEAGEPSIKIDYQA